MIIKDNRRLMNTIDKSMDDIVNDMTKGIKSTLDLQSLRYNLTENMDMKRTQGRPFDIRRYRWKQRQFWSKDKI